MLAFNDLSAGVIYLVKGTLSQLQKIVEESLEAEILYEPTGLEISRALTFNLLNTPRVVYILPKKIKGTGLLKKRSNITDEYLIPNHQFLHIDPNTYCFIVCGNDKESKSGIKSLAGGDFKVIDLDFIEEVLELEERVGKEQLLIRSLDSIEGVERWGQLTSSEIHQLFLLENVSTPLILSRSKAYALKLYLSPFIKELKRGRGNLSGITERFALWAYMSQTYWGSPFKWKSGKGGDYLSFWPSQTAKQQWHSFCRM